MSKHRISPLNSTSYCSNEAKHSDYLLALTIKLNNNVQNIHLCIKDYIPFEYSSHIVSQKLHLAGFSTPPKAETHRRSESCKSISVTAVATSLNPIRQFWRVKTDFTVQTTSQIQTLWGRFQFLLPPILLPFMSKTQRSTKNCVNRYILNSKAFFLWCSFALVLRTKSIVATMKKIYRTICSKHS